MGRPYSLDLRERVVSAVRGGMSCGEAAKRFEVSASSSSRWVERDREVGSPAALPMGGKRPFSLERELPWVLARMAERPDISLRLLLAELRERGVAVSYYAVWHIVRRSGLTSKKNAARQRARSSGRRTQARAVETLSGSH
jgi:transposase